jgi:hypothetical protein
MNTLQEYYNFTDKDVFDCKSKFGLHNVIKESGNVLLQKKHSKNQIAIRRFGYIVNEKYYITKSTHYFLNMDILCSFVTAINKLCASTMINHGRKRKRKKGERVFWCLVK